MREEVNKRVCYDERGYSASLESKPLCGYCKGVDNVCEKGKLVVYAGGNDYCQFAHSNQRDRNY
jgi:hypothetical protein